MKREDSDMSDMPEHDFYTYLTGCSVGPSVQEYNGIWIFASVNRQDGSGPNLDSFLLQQEPISEAGQDLILISDLTL